MTKKTFKRYGFRRTNKGEKTLSFDLYPTPPYLVRGLLEVEEFEGEVWEPASGLGHMSKVLEAKFPTISSDIMPRGYGMSNTDFLETNYRTDNIISNPPFNIFLKFLERAKKSARKKIAFIHKLSLLEGNLRYPMWLDKEFPLKAVYVLVQRPTFVGFKSLGDYANMDGTYPYAWYVWDREWKGEPVLRFIWQDAKVRSKRKMVWIEAD